MNFSRFFSRKKGPTIPDWAGEIMKSEMSEFIVPRTKEKWWEILNNEYNDYLESIAEKNSTRLEKITPLDIRGYADIYQYYNKTSPFYQKYLEEGNPYITYKEWVMKDIKKLYDEYLDDIIID